MPYIHVTSKLITDYARQLSIELECFGYNCQGKSDDEVILLYARFFHKSVPTRPRAILKSKNFNCPPHLELGLKLLEQKIIKGENITPHLSRQIKIPDKNDRYLNAWGIQHLHLGTTTLPNGLISGTHEVLLAIFEPHVCFFISIELHGSSNPMLWYKKEPLEIMLRDWPEWMSRFKFEENSDPNRTHSEIHEKAVRSNNANTPILLSDNYYYIPPGGGSMSNGDALIARRAADWLHLFFENYEKYAINNFTEICSILYGKISHWPKSITLRAVKRGDYILIKSDNSPNTTLAFPEIQNIKISNVSRVILDIASYSACANLFDLTNH